MLKTCEVIIGSADKFDMKLTFIGGNKSSVTACVADHWHGKKQKTNGIEQQTKIKSVNKYW